jgi:hypothetical protein
MEHDLCSAFSPVHPRPMFRVLASWGRTLAGGECVAKGLRELHAVEDGESFPSFPAETLERNLLCHALLAAYRELGDETMTRSYATKIAAEMIVSRNLSKHPEQS